MRPFMSLSLSSRIVFAVVTAAFVTVVAARAAGTAPPVLPEAVDSEQAAQPDIVQRGRYLVITHACGECHGGGNNPAAKGFLAGLGASEPLAEFKIGPPPCGTDPAAKGCFTTRPRNLTPDNDTGLGRFTERQI